MDVPRFVYTFISWRASWSPQVCRHYEQSCCTYLHPRLRLDTIFQSSCLNTGGMIVRSQREICFALETTARLSSKVAIRAPIRRVSHPPQMVLSYFLRLAVRMLSACLLWTGLSSPTFWRGHFSVLHIFWVQTPYQIRVWQVFFFFFFSLSLPLVFWLSE